MKDGLAIALDISFCHYADDAILYCRSQAEAGELRHQLVARLQAAVWKFYSKRRRTKEERVDGHLFITVLAYQFVQIIRRRLGKQGLCASWCTLRDTLSG